MPISTSRRPPSSGPSSQILKDGAVDWLRRDQGYEGIYALSYSAELRYRGQSFEIDTALDPDTIEACDVAAMADAFHREHERIYGHADPHAADPGDLATPRHQRQDGQARLSRVMSSSPAPAPPIRQAEVWLDGAQRQIDLYRRADLVPGQTFAGPAVVTQDDCTTVVPPGYVTRVDEYANLRITREAAQ